MIRDQSIRGAFVMTYLIQFFAAPEFPSSVKHGNFTPDFSNSPISNQLPFPSEGFHCNSASLS